MSRAQSSRAATLREMPGPYSLVLMNEAEARAATTAIRESLGHAAALIADVHQREGWRALGYEHFLAWAATEFPEWSRATLYRRLATGRARLLKAGSLTNETNAGPSVEAKSRGRPAGSQDRAVRYHAPTQHCPTCTCHTTPTAPSASGRLACENGWCGYTTAIGQPGDRCPKCRGARLR